MLLYSKYSIYETIPTIVEYNIKICPNHLQMYQKICFYLKGESGSIWGEIGYVIGLGITNAAIQHWSIPTPMTYPNTKNNISCSTISKKGLEHYKQKIFHFLKNDEK